jgi:methylenetetrahydrofolate reductase (NADPH)
MPNNTLQQRLLDGAPLFSIEFFPPKSDASAEQLLRTAKELKAYAPDFASITYGAGGSTRSRTLKYARQLREDYDYNVMPHLTCVGHSHAELQEIIAEFRAAGLGQIMALRGDPPKGESNFKAHPEGLHYANELVRLIRETYPECTIGVAGYPEKHPEAPFPERDLENLKRKVDTGAHFVTTQLFFDNNKYFEFVTRARQAKIEVPILPGLMCVNSREQARRFCQMCGTTLPDELDQRLAAAGDNTAALETVGIEWVYQQARELLERGAPGIHLYILNRKGPAVILMEKLKAAGFYKG